MGREEWWWLFDDDLEDFVTEVGRPPVRHRSFRSSSS